MKPVCLFPMKCILMNKELEIGSAGRRKIWNRSKQRRGILQSQKHIVRKTCAYDTFLRLPSGHLSVLVKVLAVSYEVASSTTIPDYLVCFVGLSCNWKVVFLCLFCDHIQRCSRIILIVLRGLYEVLGLKSWLSTCKEMLICCS